LVATAAAFVAPHSKKALPAARVTRAPTKAAMTMEDTYWEGEAPPSYVLGNLQNAPAALLGPVSGIFLLVGLYCVAVRPPRPRAPIFFPPFPGRAGGGAQASQLFAPLSAESVNPFYIAGSLAVPVSWGLHVRRAASRFSSSPRAARGGSRGNGRRRRAARSPRGRLAGRRVDPEEERRLGAARAAPRPGAPPPRAVRTTLW